MRNPPRRADEHLRWLRANDHDLAGLTGADHATLEAIDRCWHAIPVCDHRDNILAAVRALLPNMQRKYWHLARELIARAMDWGDREKLWPLVVPADQVAAAILDGMLEARP